MSAAATEPQDMAEIMREIRELAATRRHHLSPHMTGSRSMAKPQALAVLRNLRKCDPIDPEPPCEAEIEIKTTQNFAPPPLSAFKGIPEGYYAVRRPGTDTIDYFLIEEGKGKWAGTKFARRVLGGQPKNARKLRTEPMENMQQRVAMQRITDFGLEAAGNLFADTLERCTDCSTPLTDPVSRAARKGPYCRNKRR